MGEQHAGSGSPTSERADVVRNRTRLLTAAADVFAISGVDAPVREIAARAGVGMGTVYRHFPTRTDLVTAVFRHQVDACVEAGPRLMAEADSPFAALCAWIDLFVDFLVTKHGLAGMSQSDGSGFAALHTHFLDRLLPVAAQLLSVAAEAGAVRADVQPYELLRGVGNLCIAPDHDPRYDPRRLVELLLRGLRP